MERAFIWVFDHHTALLVAALLAGGGIIAAIRRPRRWFHWAIDALVVVVVAIAALFFWFFNTVSSTIVKRTNSLTYASLGAGAPQHVADLRGNVVVVNYWATWCPPCREEMPDLNRLADAYRGRGVVVLAISDEAPELLQKFLAKYPQSTTVARFTSAAPQGAIETMAYRGRPTTLVLGRDGRVRRMFIGKRSFDDFDQAVRASL